MIIEGSTTHDVQASQAKAKNAVERALIAAYDSARAQLAGRVEVAALRERAMLEFAKRGLPSRRVEAWHYSDLRAQMRELAPLADAPGAVAIAKIGAMLAPVEKDHVRAVLVDGRFIAQLSHAGSDGILMRPLDDVLAHGDAQMIDLLTAGDLGRDDSALALNSAFMRGGVVITVAPSLAVAPRIEIVSFETPGAPRSIFSRSMVRAGAGSRFTLVERRGAIAGARAQKNEALVLVCEAGAQIEHVFHRERMAEGDLHVCSLLASLASGSKLNSVALIEGGGFLRRQIFARFDGADAQLSLAGATLLRGQDHADTTLVVEHAHPRNVSREYFKHIVDDAATGVFQGKVVVAPHAQQTDGVMKSQTILMGAAAAMYNKPELEIFADDVTCGHGATVGALDPSQVFYAMSRGVPRREAEIMLLEAFVSDAIERSGDESMREKLTERVRLWLNERAS